MNKFIHKISIIFAVCLIFSASDLFSEESVIVLGGKDGWKNPSKMDGTCISTGKYGYQCVALDTNSHKVDSNTDLLINFEDKQIQDKTGNYKVTGNKSVCVESAYMGEYAGSFKGTGGISLSGNSSSIFGKNGMTGSFIIDFWLNPSIVENGEILLSWRSSRTVNHYPLYQMISSSFVNNHLEWAFINIFDGYTKDDGEVKISSSKTIIPNKWAHHQLTYDENTGMLEYRIDGKLESLVYVTTNGRENNGSIYPMMLGVVADISICPQFTGLLDDFRIQHGTESEVTELLRYDLYKSERGRYETQPIYLEGKSIINRLDAEVNIPEQTDVVFYVRSGDNYFNWTEETPEWIPVKNHEELKNIDGTYVQVAFDLYTDGNGTKTPQITEMDIVYSKVPLPLPPYKISAEAKDGSVVVSWSYSVDENVAGYYLYYGEHPGEYLGSIALQGTSPIEVGNTVTYEISGLKNGKIYYFAVASYSKYNKDIVGELSEEVFARPLKN